MSELNDAPSRYQFGQTRWTVVLHAGKTDDAVAAEARNQLLVRYSEAVYRYLNAKLGDPNAASEIFSRFAERVLEIHPFIQRADPEKGRFRDYLKAVLHRMVIDYHRENQRQRKRMKPITPGTDEEPIAHWSPPDGEDADFKEAWKQELQNQAWKALERHGEETGKPYHALVLYKSQNEDARSEEMAQIFSQRLGRELTPENVRKLIQRGKELLNELLVDEVARSLKRDANDTVTTERIEEELINLGLFNRHRRKALDGYRPR